jgi:predicted MPP superfamily phosphohydrolase
MAWLEVIWLVGAAVGHVALLSFSLNWWYGHALPQRFLHAVRQVHGLLVLVGLSALILAWLRGFAPRQALASDSVAEMAAGAYVLGCRIVGLGILPVVTLQRWFARRPAALVAERARTVDVAEQLGYRPIGHGKHRRLATLPGNQVFTVDLAERTVCLPRLPQAWDGLSILHLSDLHFSGTPERAYFEQVMDLCREWEPDLVAVTGDIVDTDHHHRWIVPLLGRLRWRVAAFAILGNHDSWYEPALVRRRLRRLGFHVLGNGWQQIEIGGEPLVVIGNETPWFRPAPDLNRLPAEGLRLCLSHTPDNLAWAKEHGFDLVLAGHNHGGQIRFPVVGSVLVPSRYSRRYDCGLFQEGPTVLHVSRGLGGQHPLRYGCRPEVTRLLLRAPERTADGTLPGVRLTRIGKSPARTPV